MGEVRTFLEEHLHPLAGPYLFVGAGFSRRYAGLPNWRDLLTHFAETTGMPFGYYESGTLPTAASKLAASFHEVWWKSGDYSDSVEEWQDRVAGDIALPLKVEITKYLNDLTENFAPPSELEEEWALLVESTIDGLITTNYDNLLEKAFPTYEVYVGQEGLLFTDPQGIAEIYSIHGATSNPASLVLTEEDYKVYHDRNAYLAAKLMTVFVEHPVVFLGYSFNDENIQDILLSLVRGLLDKSVEKLQDRLVFIEWVANATPSIQRTHVNVGGQLLPIIRIVVPDWIEVFQALGARKHALNARTLRILKEQVYEIVLTNDPKDRLFAYKDIDDDTAKDISVVFGVGAKVAMVGIVGLSRSDIWSDVLQNPDGGYPAIDVLNKHIASIRWNTYYPVWKYLRSAGKLDAEGGIVDAADLRPPVVARHALSLSKLVLDIPGVVRQPVSALEEANGWDFILTKALALPAYTDDIEGLREFLIRHQKRVLSNSWWRVQYAKAIVAYDYIRFAREPS